jgi:hypothetical protein
MCISSLLAVVSPPISRQEQKKTRMSRAGKHGFPNFAVNLGLGHSGKPLTENLHRHSWNSHWTPRNWNSHYSIWIDCILSDMAPNTENHTFSNTLLSVSSAFLKSPMSTFSRYSCECSVAKTWNVGDFFAGPGPTSAVRIQAK